MNPPTTASTDASAQPRVILVCRSPARRALLDRVLNAADIYSSGAEALWAVARSGVRAAVLDFDCLRGRARELLAGLKKAQPDLAIYLLVEAEDEPAARDLLEVGATQYFLLPGEADELAHALASAGPPPAREDKPLPAHQEAPAPDAAPELPAEEKNPPPENEQNESRDEQQTEPPPHNESRDEQQTEPPPHQETPDATDQARLDALRDAETGLLKADRFRTYLRKLMARARECQAEVALVLLEPQPAPEGGSAEPETLGRLGRAIGSVLTGGYRGGRLAADRYAVAWAREVGQPQDADDHHLGVIEALVALGPHVDSSLRLHAGLAVSSADGTTPDALLAAAEERLTAQV